MFRKRLVCRGLERNGHLHDKTDAVVQIVVDPSLLFESLPLFFVYQFLDRVVLILISSQPDGRYPEWDLNDLFEILFPVHMVAVLVSDGVDDLTMVKSKDEYHAWSVGKHADCFNCLNRFFGVAPVQIINHDDQTFAALIKQFRNSIQVLRQHVSGRNIQPFGKWVVGLVFGIVGLSGIC